jgi:phage/plasmid-associated DNA primase
MSLSHALSDPGVARRFDIITFKSAKEWSKRDPSLSDKLSTDESRAGIGKSLAEALIDVMKSSDNKLKRPVALQNELDNLRREGDPLESFLDHLGLAASCTPLCNTVEIHQDRLYSEFKVFCVENGYREWSIRKFKSRLRGLSVQELDAGSRKHKYQLKCDDLLRLKKARLII